MPERLIESDPAAYVRDVMGKRSAGLAPFDPRALREYQRCLALPGAAHGICEDYRAAAGIDLEHDRFDRSAGRKLTMPLLALWASAGRKLTMPLLALWGEQGVVGRCFEPLEEWKLVADDVQGGALPCGHYIAEEAPELLLGRVLPFLGE